MPCSEATGEALRGQSFARAVAQVRPPGGRGVLARWRTFASPGEVVTPVRSCGRDSQSVFYSMLIFSV